MRNGGAQLLLEQQRGAPIARVRAMRCAWRGQKVSGALEERARGGGGGGGGAVVDGGEIVVLDDGAAVDEEEFERRAGAEDQGGNRIGDASMREAVHPPQRDIRQLPRFKGA